ncbi:DUF1206 domain-containing protein [Humibacter sp. BT305]|nr:DUF1206 domain-containing protein [Humibacter sp. BT305]
MGSASGTAKSAARTAEGNPVLRILARTGYAVNGLLHILIGIIAIAVAVGAGGSQEADQSGALKQLSSNPIGYAVVWIVVVGLFALGLWQIISGFLVHDEDSKKRWAKRIGEWAKAAVYLVIGGTALSVALGSDSSSSESTSSMSATLLASPGGVFLVVAIGIGVFAAGVSFVVIGVRRSFTKKLVVPPKPAGSAVVTLGVVGYVAKGIALAVVGVLFVVAAFTHDAQQASGLDGALKALAALPFGVVVLSAVGVGLIAYGIFLGARARWARL